MALLIAIFYLSLFLYSLALVFFLLGLFRKKGNGSNDKPFVSIIIAAKNEQEKIENILDEVIHQTYPPDGYEVIVVDDESTDLTPNICRAFADKYPNITLLSTRGLCSPLRYKKKPLSLGIKHANGEIILLTDADCHVASTWIESMISCFTPDVGMVVGYSETKPATTRLDRIQALDFLMLMSSAYGATQLRSPFACTGQNLAYRKRAFNEVGGFSAFGSAVGGDDTLLLQQFKNKTRWKIVFANAPASRVSTPPLPTLPSYLTQRIRWASDSLSIIRTDPPFFAIAVTTFVTNAVSVVVAAATLFSGSAFLPLLKGLLAKFIVEGALMLRGTHLFSRKELRSVFPAWFFFQIPYVALMGILSIAGSPMSWGGRNR